MTTRSHDDDAQVWASSIGSDTIDIVDSRSPQQPVRALRAGPSDKSMQALRSLLESLKERQ